METGKERGLSPPVTKAPPPEPSRPPVVLGVQGIAPRKPA